MADLQQYWQAVRAIQAGLHEFVWLISLSDAVRGLIGGALVQVKAAQAAQALHTKSHRLATEEEVQAYLAREAAASRRILEENLRRTGVAIVPILPPVL